MLIEYHDERDKLSSAKKNRRPSKDMEQRREMETDIDSTSIVDPIEEDWRQLGNMNCEFLSAKCIEEMELRPIKVLNITHVKGEEKNLVAQITFDGMDDPSFVYTTWANTHCPQLIIAYYESRIHWEKRS